MFRDDVDAYTMVPSFYRGNDTKRIYEEVALGEREQ